MLLTLPCPRFLLSILTGGRLHLCQIGFLGKVVLKALHSWEERDQPYNLPFVHSCRVYCMLGDGEVSEGSVWEAMAFAGIYKLDNLVAILTSTVWARATQPHCSTKWTSTRSAERPLGTCERLWPEKGCSKARALSRGCTAYHLDPVVHRLS